MANANYNKVILIGRLTRDPEYRVFSNGGAVARFGFAVSSRRKNQATGQWEDGDPMFIDVKAFNREFRKHADFVRDRFQKGSLMFLEGRLVFEQWDDNQTGQKRTKHVMYLENYQFLESKPEDGMGQPAASSQYSGSNADQDFGAPDTSSEFGGSPDEENIPF